MSDAAQIPSPDSPQPRRRVSPLIVIFAGTLGAVALFVLFAVVAITMQDEVPLRSGLMSAKMPDGTLLVLEDVTYGTHHELEVDMPTRGFSFLPNQATRMVDDRTSEDRLMLWFTRRNEKTGQYLDFDWWMRCVAVDEHGCEIEDENPGVDAFGPNGSSGHHGSRPLNTSGGGMRYPRTVAHSTMRRFRHEGDTFKLLVYDVNDQVVAEFDVPDKYPDQGRAPEWEPQSLPLTLNNEEVAVRINAVTSNVSYWTMDGKERENVNIQLDQDVLIDGQTTSDWYVDSFRLSDALGNTSSLYDCQLCPLESAWSVDMRVFRTSSATFAPSEMWVAPALNIPDADVGEYLTESTTIDGVTITLAAIGGPGTVRYTNLAPGGSNSSYSGGAGSTSFEIDTDSSSGPRGSSSGSTTRVECALPHVAARFDGTNPEQQVALRVQDDQGRDVKAHGPYVSSDIWFWFVEPAEDAESLELTYIIHRGHNFSALIAPPEIKRPPRKISDGEVAERLANVTSTPLMFCSTRDGNAAIHLIEPGIGMRNLTGTETHDSGCAYSPDGRQIAFARHLDRQYDLFVMDADGRNLRQLTTHPEHDRAPCWSPDGQKLLFCRTVDNNNWELFTIKLDGSAPVNLTNHPANDADPAWSPDGAKIAFTSTRDGSDYDVFVMDADGQNVRKVSETSAGYTYPAWSPDGTRIAFAGVANSSREIFVCDAEGGNEQQLTMLGGLNVTPAWSPDGSLIAFLHHDEGVNPSRMSLYVAPVDGSEPTLIAPAEAYLGDGAGRPAWQPVSGAAE